MFVYLAMAHKYLPIQQYPANFRFDTDPENFSYQGLTFMGLIAMIDPPRASVPNAVENCRNAGIKVNFYFRWRASFFFKWM